MLPEVGEGNKRRNNIFQHLVLSNPNPEKNKPLNFLIAARKVCPKVFCAHWCLSRAQLDRYAGLVKQGFRQLPSQSDVRVPRESKKKDSVITWFNQYAVEVTEKLPDSDCVLLPRMEWQDLHNMFKSDMMAAGYDDGDICTGDHFRKTFHNADELRYLQMTTFKRNFSKCSGCVTLTAAVLSALKSHDGTATEKAKAARYEHYVLARSDKIHYWQQRWQARSPVALKITLIIDKMDSAKNHVPWFSNGRRPKDAEPLLKEALKLHITGVIIHGKPDKRFLFWSLPHLPGNANLNLECLRRALVHHLASMSFRPKLYIQIDNASDNKCIATLCTAGWLVKEKYVSQVELCMMMPGHTHEDIDAMFRFIADALRSRSLIRTIDELVEAAMDAFIKQSVHVEHVAAVHDYTKWLKPLAGKFEGIKSARYFIIALRESDGRPVMWYKPHAGHEHLYPTEKESTTKMPVYTMTAGNEKLYKTDFNGIEIFGDEMPKGAPGLQDFENERLNVKETCELTTSIIDMYPLLFGEGAREWWVQWGKSTPVTAADAVVQHPMEFVWPQKSAEWRPPTLDGLRSEYQETITYLNSGGSQAFNIRQAEEAEREENRSRPALSVGDLLILKPGADDGMHRLPFWMGEVADDVSSDTDNINIRWRTAFKGGYAKDDPEGQWLLLCVGCVKGRGGIVKYHAYTDKCRVRRADRQGHGCMLGTVERDQVALYFPKLTKKSSHMCALLIIH